MEGKVVTVCEYIWRCIYHVVVFESGDKDLQNPRAWGSGFFLNTRNGSVFVTADHVIHYQDYDEDRRTGIDNIVVLPSYKNVEGEIASVFASLPSFYDFTGYDLEWPDITDFVDCAVSLIVRDVEDVYTDNVKAYDGSVIVPAGLKKCCISVDTISKPLESESFIVAGKCHNKVTGVKMEYENAWHEDIKYEGTNGDGNYIFKNAEPVNHDDWKGLSGSPVFDSHLHLVGMLLRDAEVNDTLIVMPMKRVLEIIELAKRMYKDEVDGGENYIEVNG